MNTGAPQYHEKILCDLVTTAEGLCVKFNSMERMETGAPRYYARPERSGQVLFSLAHEGGRLVTRWQGLSPSTAVGAEDVYFAKE